MFVTGWLVTREITKFKGDKHVLTLRNCGYHGGVEFI